MEVDFLIVGQGISGTMLSWELHKEEKTFLVLDREDEITASKVAAGIINPVTGRRYAYTWMIDELMTFALAAYKSIEDFLGDRFITTRSIIDFFPTAQMRNAFVERVAENDTYIHPYSWQNQFNPDFNYEFGCGEIRPAYMVYFLSLLQLWKKHLQTRGQFRNEPFVQDELTIHSDGIRYKGIAAKKIIFCDGVAAADNKWFRLLPFAPNKGEMVIIECEGLNREHIFKKSLMLVPLEQANLYWVGSNYQWEFTDILPSDSFLHHATNVLNGWLRKPWRLLEHRASVRPATVERRPFVGLHPVYPQLCILNGLGTKGATLAPFFAHQLTQLLVHNIPVLPEADVRRFSKVLSR